MKLPLGPRDASRLARMTPEELHEFLSKCSPRDFLWLDAQFEMWAANGQIEPEEDGCRVWLMMAGRGFGKTRAGAEWVHNLAMTGRKQIALVGATIDEARSIMVEGVSGLLSIARRKRITVNWEPSLKKLRYPMGSVATLYSGDNADGLRGPEHHFAWGFGADRHVVVPHRRGRPSGRSAGEPGDRRLLPHCPGRVGGVARPGRLNCLLHRRGLAFCHANRRA